MQTQQESRQFAKRNNRKAKHNRQRRHDPNASDVGDGILFAMFALILLVLAVVMNNAIRDTYYMIRDALP